MTDFFADLEQELRRAHRRDSASHARSGVFVRRRLSGLAAAGVRPLVAVAVVAAIVAAVLAVALESDVEREAAAPPSPTTAPGAHGGCLPSERWKPPIVDEPIPQEIASRFAVFRDHPRRTGELPRDLRDFCAGRLADFLRPQDRIIVAPFTKSLGAITGPTGDRNTIAEAVGAIASKGGTAICDGLKKKTRFDRKAFSTRAAATATAATPPATSAIRLRRGFTCFPLKRAGRPEPRDCAAPSRTQDQQFER